jgi:hypothetical protein
MWLGVRHLLKHHIMLQFATSSKAPCCHARRMMLCGHAVCAAHLNFCGQNDDARAA